MKKILSIDLIGLLTAIAVICLITQQSHAQNGFPNNMNDEEDELFAQMGCCGGSTGVATWQVSEPYLNLWVVDQPLTYQTSSGSSIGFAVAFKQRNSRSNSRIFGVGPSWEASWLSYVEYTASGGPPATITVGATYVPLGGRRSYTADGVAKEFKSASTMTKLTDGSGNLTGFQIDKPDGSRDLYAYLYNVSSTENYALLSQQIDANGRINRLNYDVVENVVRLRTMVDFNNRTNTIRYDGTFTSQISEVENHYGDKATFSYDLSGKLSSIRDVGAMTNSFIYDAQGLVSSFTTQYGTTSFRTTTNAFAPYNLGGTNAVNRSVEITDADLTKQLYLYRDQSTKLNAGSAIDLIPAAYPGSEVPTTWRLRNTLDNSKMDARNTFSWNAKQYSGLNATFKSTGNFSDLVVTDYKIATLHHWLRGYNNEAVVSRALSLGRAASPDGVTDGQKLWLDYAGKVNLGDWNWGTQGTNASPLFIARLVPDGTSQITYTEVNRWELPTHGYTSYSVDWGVSARENKMTYSVNDKDRIEWRGPSGELLSSNAYNGFHQVVTQFNAVNDRTDYTYDSEHRLTSVLSPSGLLTTNYFYTTGTHVGWLERTIDFEGTLALRTNTFAYDKGLIISSTDARGLPVNRTWDALQRPTSVVIPDGAYLYQYSKLDLTNVVNPLTYTNCFTYDNMGRMCIASFACDPNTQGSAFQTHTLNYGSGLLNSYVNPLQQPESYSYDFAGHLLTTTFADTSVVVNRYDCLGRLTNVTDAAGTSVTNWYNNQGLLCASSNAFGQTFYRKYDNRDRLTNQIDANGVAVATAYDNLNRPLTRSYPDGGVEQFQYSARGLISFTNQLGKVTHFGYDALGRKTAETNANNEVTRYSYNGAGDLLSVTDGKNQSTWFGYDQYGRSTNQVDATGTTVLRLKYDVLGRLTNRWSLAKGDTGYSYDPAGNLVKIDYPNSPDVTYLHDNLNRLVWMNDGVGTTSLQYTTFGALLSEQLSTWPNSTVSYAYRTNHLRASLSVQQALGPSVVHSYDYDAANRLRSVSAPSGTFSYSYQGAGGLVQKIAYPGGAYVTNSYDSVGRLAFTKLKNSVNTDLNSHVYQINAGNQRTNQTRLDGSKVDYGYDDIGQLKSATGREPNGTVRLHENLGYGYDAAGSLNYRTNNALVQTFWVDSRNQLTNVSRANTLTVRGATSLAVTNVTVNGVTASRYATILSPKRDLSRPTGSTVTPLSPGIATAARTPTPSWPTFR